MTRVMRRTLRARPARCESVLRVRGGDCASKAEAAITQLPGVLYQEDLSRPQITRYSNCRAKTLDTGNQKFLPA